MTGGVIVISECYERRYESQAEEQEAAMRALRLWLLFILGFSVLNVPVVAQTGGTNSVNQPEQAKLRLSTMIVDERSSLERDRSTLSLTLKLTYTNDGTVPILLDRKSVLIYRAMVSKSLKAAASQRYIEDQVSHFIALWGRGSDPEEDAFITLQAGESFSVSENPKVVFYSHPKNPAKFLFGGDYFLQVKVATWYYFAEPDEYQERWSAKGYLWSSNMTSEPMPFSINRNEAANK